jgi:hypothetical protein
MLTDKDWDSIFSCFAITGLILGIWSLLNEPSIAMSASLVTATTSAVSAPEVASHMMTAYGHATAPTAWYLPGIHEVAFLLHTAVLVLMLDAMVAIVFYFHKRRARFASPPASLPVRPALLSPTIVSEVATVATRICNSLCEWLLYSYSTTFHVYRARAVVKCNTRATPFPRHAYNVPMTPRYTNATRMATVFTCASCA